MRLRGIAESQRRVMLCILGQFGLAIGNLYMRPDLPHRGSFIGVVYILIAIATFYFNVQLAARLKGTGTAVTVGIFSVIPLLGLLMLLMVSGWATKALRQAGFKVGLLGGNPRHVQRAIDAQEKQTT